MSKPTLVEMMEACRTQADLRYAQLAIRAKYYPDRPEDPLVRRDAEVFDRAMEIFALMATYEDRSRAFIVDLMKEHRS